MGKTGGPGRTWCTSTVGAAVVAKSVRERVAREAMERWSEAALI
jgi:hypothetical protein